MCCDTHGVVRLRPEVTWADVLRLFESSADPSNHAYADELGMIHFDPDTHEVSYSLDPDTWPLNVDFLTGLEALAQEGWVSLPGPLFLGPDPTQTALRYWTEQRDQAQAHIDGCL